MKKVYLVINNAVQECADLGVGTSCYDSYDKARKVFQDIVMDERQVVEDSGWKIETDTDEEFVAYEEGYYNTNHTWVEIREMIIE
jgi:hypothetical protein